MKKRLIHSYGSRYFAKPGGTVEPYYEEDVMELEALVRKAASGRAIDRELTRLIEQGVDYSLELTNEIKSLRRRLRASEEQCKQLVTAVEALKASNPRPVFGYFRKFFRK